MCGEDSVTSCARFGSGAAATDAIFTLPRTTPAETVSGFWPAPSVLSDGEGNVVAAGPGFVSSVGLARSGATLPAFGVVNSRSDVVRFATQRGG
jgi:hypothetical protein